MEKRSANPFRRGLGGKDDFIAERFVPGEQYKARQLEMAQKLIVSGVDPKEVAEMFAVPLDLIEFLKATEPKP